MNIGTTFVTDLRGKREGWDHAMVETFDWASEAGELTLRVRDFDKFGYLLDELTVRGKRAIARPEFESFIERVTYLTEALRLVEWDEELIGLARSTPGEMDTGAKEYFELTARARDLTLRRFATGSRRQRVPFHLTERQLARLVDDLDALCAIPGGPGSLRTI